MSEDLKEKRRVESLSDEEKSEMVSKLHQRIREEKEQIMALKRKNEKKERDKMIRKDNRKGWCK